MLLKLLQQGVKVTFVIDYIHIICRIFANEFLINLNTKYNKATIVTVKIKHVFYIYLDIEDMF